MLWSKPAPPGVVAAGVGAFASLPIEAFPDVSDIQVNVITLYPGHAAEEVEQQVTIPIEAAMNGLPHLEHLRSTSIFGLSSVMLVFDDASGTGGNSKIVLCRVFNSKGNPLGGTFYVGDPDAEAHEFDSAYAAKMQRLSYARS